MDSATSERRRHATNRRKCAIGFCKSSERQFRVSTSPSEKNLRALIDDYNSQVNQIQLVEVNRLSIANPHSVWRFYRQSSKYMVELAICAHDPEIQKLLVELSNKYLVECQRVAPSPIGKELA